MKTRLAILIVQLALLGLLAPAHAQPPMDPQQAWNSALERMAQRVRETETVRAVAAIERRIQREGETKPTLITKAKATIWIDHEKYRVEIENEVSLQAPKLAMPYSATGIRRETIVFDGLSVFQARDMLNGARTGLDYSREIALPLIFAGFPSADPVHPWTFYLRHDRLQKRQFDCAYLNSGMIVARSKQVSPTGRVTQLQTAYLLPGSSEIRRYEAKDASGKRFTSIDLTWGKSDGAIFLKRFLRDGITASSQFAGPPFRDIIDFEILDYQADVSMPEDWFSRDALGQGRQWIEMPSTY